jgi:hypothetical protein
VQQLPPEGEEPSEVPIRGLIVLILIVSMAIIAVITVCVLQRKRGVKVEKKEILQTYKDDCTGDNIRQSCINKDDADTE